VWQVRLRTAIYFNLYDRLICGLASAVEFAMRLRAVSEFFVRSDHELLLHTGLRGWTKQLMYGGVGGQTRTGAAPPPLRVAPAAAGAPAGRPSPSLGRSGRRSPSCCRRMCEMILLVAGAALA